MTKLVGGRPRGLLWSTQLVINFRGRRRHGIRATCPVQRSMRESMYCRMGLSPSRSSSELVVILCLITCPHLTPHIMRTALRNAVLIMLNNFSVRHQHSQPYSRIGRQRAAKNLPRVFRHILLFLKMSRFSAANAPVMAPTRFFMSSSDVRSHEMMLPRYLNLSVK